jgi:hypothetical protein
MKDAKGHGSNKRGEVDLRTQAAMENFKRLMLGTMRAGLGAHSVGIHQATAGKTLAETSAEGATNAKVGGSNE